MTIILQPLICMSPQETDECGLWMCIESFDRYFRVKSISSNSGIRTHINHTRSNELGKIEAVFLQLILKQKSQDREKAQIVDGMINTEFRNKK